MKDTYHNQVLSIHQIAEELHDKATLMNDSLHMNWLKSTTNTILSTSTLSTSRKALKEQKDHSIHQHVSVIDDNNNEEVIKQDINHDEVSLHTNIIQENEAEAAEDDDSNSNQEYVAQYLDVIINNNAIIYSSKYLANTFIELQHIMYAINHSSHRSDNQPF